MRRNHVVLGAAIVLGALMAWWLLRTPPPREEAVYPSPEGKCRVVVYRQPHRFAMPGQGGDAAGLIRLICGENRVVQETAVGMVREVRPPEWRPDRVVIPMIAEWTLPQ